MRPLSRGHTLWLALEGRSCSQWTAAGYELEFERPLTALERQIGELEAQNDPNRSAVGGVAHPYYTVGVW